MSTVRPATLADIPRIVELRRHSFDAGRLDEWAPFDPEHFEGLLQAIITDPAAFALVAEVDGVVEGATYGALGPMYLSRALKTAHELFCWVEPKARGNGIGKALVGAIEDWAREHGAAFVVMSAYPKLAPHVMKRLCLTRGYSRIETNYMRRV